MKKLMPLILLGMLFLIAYWENRKKSAEEDDLGGDYLPMPKMPPSPKYKRRRKQVLSATPKQLGLDLPDDKTVVYGMAMDWHASWGARGTLFAYKTGIVGCLTNGGDKFTFQADRYEKLQASANQFIELGDIYLKHATKTNTPHLPPEDITRFYFLTNRGLFVGDTLAHNKSDVPSEWSKLSWAADKTLDALLFVRDYPPPNKVKFSPPPPSPPQLPV